MADGAYVEGVRKFGIVGVGTDFTSRRPIAVVAHIGRQTPRARHSDIELTPPTGSPSGGSTVFVHEQVESTIATIGERDGRE